MKHRIHSPWRHTRNCSILQKINSHVPPKTFQGIPVNNANIAQFCLYTWSHIREEHMQCRKRHKWFPTCRDYYLGDHTYAQLSECQEETFPLMSKTVQRMYERYTKSWVKVYMCFKCDYSTRMLSRMESHFCISHTLDDLNLWMEYQKLNTHDTIPEAERKWFKCDQCDYRSYRQNEMTQHFIHNHNNILSCALCSFRTTSPQGMDAHLKFFCKNVPRTPYMPALDRHSQKCHCLAAKRPVKVTALKQTATTFNQIYSCVECSFQTDNIKVLSVHSRQVHVKKKRVDGKQHLNQRLEHSPMDQKNPEFLFVECDFASNKKRPSYSCTQCDYKTKTLNMLKSHERQKHGLVREYSCNYCQYTSNEKWAVLRHVYVRHTPDD